MTIRLGKYELLEQLGRGGYGTVWRAQDTVLNVVRAVKVLHPALIADLEFVERFRNEAQVAARLDHPHILPVYDLDQEGGQVFLAMKYMPGGSLKDLLASQGSLHFEQALEIIGQIADALDYAHNQPEQLVHRDIKPGNILFEADGTARLGDFGFAKALQGVSSTTLSASGGMVGTPPYMAPEVWRGKGANPATDVYSLACVLCEMLTGQVLFPGDSPPEVMTRHVLEAPAFPAQWPEGIPAGIEELLGKALAKDPGERYGNAGEFAAALGEIEKSKETVIREEAVSEQQSAISGKQAAVSDQMREVVGEITILPQGVPRGGGESPAEIMPPIAVPKIRREIVIGLVVLFLSSMVLILCVLTIYYRGVKIQANNAAEDQLAITQGEFDNPIPSETATEKPLPSLVEAETQTSVPRNTPRPTSTPTRYVPPPPRPTNPPLGAAMLVLDQDYFCRGGPASTYPELWTFYAGAELEILGQASNGWYLIRFHDPGTRKCQCWIGGGTVRGDASQIPFSDWTGEGYECP